MLPIIRLSVCSDENRTHLYDWIWPTCVQKVRASPACLLDSHATKCGEWSHCEKHLAPQETKTLLPCTAETLKPIRAMSHMQHTQCAAGLMKSDITSSTATPIWLSRYKLDKRHVIQFITPPMMQPLRYHDVTPESVLTPECTDCTYYTSRHGLGWDAAVDDTSETRQHITCLLFLLC